MALNLIRPTCVAVLIIQISLVDFLSMKSSHIMVKTLQRLGKEEILSPLLSSKSPITSSAFLSYCPSSLHSCRFFSYLPFSLSSPLSFPPLLWSPQSLPNLLLLIPLFSGVSLSILSSLLLSSWCKRFGETALTGGGGAPSDNSSKLTGPPLPQQQTQATEESTGMDRVFVCV